MSAGPVVINNIDTIYAEIGEFGSFQIVSIFLICIPSLLSASYVVNYIIATNTLDYRSVELENHGKTSSSASRNWQ